MELASLLGALLVDGGALKDLLKSEESAIGRRVRLLMKGREGEDVTLSAPGFQPDELIALNGISAKQTERFRSALRRIVFDKEFGDLNLVAARLNEALDLAVSELLQRGGGVQGLSFGGVLRQLRESLYILDASLSSLSKS